MSRLDKSTVEREMDNIMEEITRLENAGRNIQHGIDIDEHIKETRERLKKIRKLWEEYNKLSKIFWGFR